MEIIHDVQAFQQRMLAERQQGKKISFVPTMGFLHQGHLSLLEEGRGRGDLLVLSIFVNPTQFGPNEDFDSYPRALQRDAELAAKTGVDILFAPEADAMYPQGSATTVQVTGLSEGLCGASRPGHFDGVTTVVNKLFNLVQPHVALFGMKDFQQLAVIRKMVSDLNMPITILGMPIVREPDGLAMSSRNTYLSDDLRRQGLSLIASIRSVCESAVAGQRDAATLIAQARDIISAQPDARIDYIQICHDETLQDLEQVDEHAVILLAVRFSTTRLIDNHYLLQPVRA
ncbi:pantoate--beta-alanine ligase [Desulfuromonas acetoxidans]|uniref:Pantothenate synthetase n=1 Tax=Desulfuromonas acetoxidans (strain DSM 684 / 11070) TaxID=281689 RepID=Q1K1M2_DESA6|nr:pantoate--beta-alanine ligase [Desulfuromonas acetoxidans]EAT16366.1 pantoate--beta-alanine ligase [Desulfuromonas acetoxidans DSM 684]MBF0646994.1 pantoate--beta-alanine ligase [Desulfuromonas acetoxidans]NVD23506.1 pantoate--beta-alanine ligase [Desulfuromonas acetoxidans]NVE16108.1 pantoate--beta-alanine ligase [Desulfuromonas acetoxidans]